MNYKLGFVLLNACFSDYSAGARDIEYWFPDKPFRKQVKEGPIRAGGRDLLSGTQSSVFGGSKVILSPFNGIPGFKDKLPEIGFEAHDHPSDILSPGDQGTKGN